MLIFLSNVEELPMHIFINVLHKCNSKSSKPVFLNVEITPHRWDIGNFEKAIKKALLNLFYYFTLFGNYIFYKLVNS